MKEFMYVFQISKLITFEVNFYTLGTNSAPYFSTSANEFCRSKLDYTRGGQAQRDLLPKFSPARRFFEKWDHCHLHDLTPAEYEEIAADIEELKTRYNYIEDIRDTFRGSRSSIPFYDIVKLSKMEPKKVHDREQNAVDTLAEVFQMDTETRNRLYIAARAVNRWRNATQWARLIPDTMQDQIRRFIFGEPEAPNSTCKYCGVWQA